MEGGGKGWACQTQTIADLPLSSPSPPPQAVQSNGTLYLHVVMGDAGHPLDASLPGFNASRVFRRALPAVAFHPRPKRVTGVKLLSGEEPNQHPLSKVDAVEEEEEAVVGGVYGETTTTTTKRPREIISFLKPNLTVAMIDDFTVYNAKAVPDHVNMGWKWVVCVCVSVGQSARKTNNSCLLTHPFSLPSPPHQMAPLLDVDIATMTYAPTLWLNDFWLMRDYLLPLNSTLTSANITLSLYTLPAWKLMLYTQMDASFAMHQSWGAMADGESDSLKRVLTEGNPYFLALTMFVSLLHSVFDALAFKNDIGFWKGKKDVAGLSVRTIGFNAACQAIIFLYLLDNETSFVVLASTGVGVAIELWKLTQAMDVTFVVEGRRPRLAIKDKASYATSQTDHHDAVAMKWLSIALVPCVGGYAVYTLLNETHKSWYSWILSSLVGAVYAFGFALMCPQLYLNYKLKSVAHLPWRQMTYKFLNTIIDDMFAFVIKMPTLHRLSVFRDDIVFAIYIYQRWIYRVDKTRANEFGYQEEGGEEEGDKKDDGNGDEPPALVEMDAAGAGPSGPAADGLRRRDNGKAAVAAQ